MRLIDADEALLELDKELVSDEFNYAVRAISRVKTADVVERKKGFWEWGEDEDYRCSVCLKYAYGCLGEVLSGHYKYCPFCGCAMEGEEDDD